MRVFIFIIVSLLLLPYAAASSIGVAPPELTLSGGCARVSVFNPNGYPMEVHYHPVRNLSIEPKNLTLPASSSEAFVVCDRGAAAGKHTLRLIASGHGGRGGGYHPGALVQVSINRTENISEVTGHIARGALSQQDRTENALPSLSKDGVGVLITLSIVCVGLTIRWMHHRFSSPAT